MVLCEYLPIAVVKVNAKCTSGAVQLIAKCGLCRSVSAASYQKLEHIVDGKRDICQLSKLNKRPCDLFFIVQPSIYYEKRCANAHSIFGALREFYEAARKPPINMSVGLLDSEEHELLLVQLVKHCYWIKWPRLNLVDMPNRLDRKFCGWKL